MMPFNMGYRSKKRVRLGAGAVPSVHTAASSGPGQSVFGRRCSDDLLLPPSDCATSH